MYIATDIGSSFFKLACLEINKNNIQIISCKRTAVSRIATQNPGEYEYDVAEIAECIKAFIDEKIQAGAPVEGILITTQMHGYVLRDNRKRKYYNYISWQDERCLEKHSTSNVAFIDELRGIVPPDIISRSGMRLKCEMALCNLYAQSSVEQLNLSEGIEVFTLGSYIINSLCGRNITHITNAAPTGFYDLKSGGCPNTQLLGIIGAEGLLLPDVISGFVPCGIYRGIPVYPDIGDQQVCMLAGNVNSETLNINIGTATQMSSVASEWDNGFYDSIYELRPYFNGNYLKTVTKLPGGRSLQVIADLFGDTVKIFTGKQMTNSEIWDVFMSISDIPCENLEVKTGFFRGLLYNKGEIKNINANNLTPSSLASGAFDDLARVYNEIIPVIDPEQKAKSLVICGKFGESVRSRLKLLENAGKYNIVLSNDPAGSFRGLGMLMQERLK